MTIYTFLQLKEDEQANAVWDLGQFLAHRVDESNDYALYEINDFFVEVTYQGDINRIVRIRPFRSMRLLELYWQCVELGDIQDLL
ncbi:MAG TPA: hypothetical protein VGB63_16085 [Pedobacter sp.]|jgi:hypothetical protein